MENGLNMIVDVDGESICLPIFIVETFSDDELIDYIDSQYNILKEKKSGRDVNNVKSL